MPCSDSAAQDRGDLQKARRAHSMTIKFLCAACRQLTAHQLKAIYVNSISLLDWYKAHLDQDINLNMGNDHEIDFYKNELERIYDRNT